MVKRLIIIIFLLTQPVKAECKYYAEADVKDGKIDILICNKAYS